MRHVSAAPPTVLAVDDDSAIRESLSLVLREHCQLLVASDGQNALDLLATHSVDVVLLDLLMPRMHGTEVLAQIRRRDLRTPVIILSALCEPASIVAAMKAGAWNYVTKPWEDQYLIELVQCAANERREEPGVLLISDDVASLVPVHLALEGHVRVAAMSVARSLTSHFRAHVVVLNSRRCAVETARAVQERFPDASLIISADPEACGRLAPLKDIRITDALDSVRPERVLRALAAVRVIREVPRQPAAVNAALAFITDHYGDRLTVADIAQAARLSEDRLAHVFRATTGFSVRDYITRFRMTVADRLLCETSETLEAISSGVGCADASSLHRAFREFRGVSPGEYRRSLRSPS